MSDVVAEFGRVQDAFDRPALTLPYSKWAPVAITVFRSAFSRERRTAPAERLRAQVSAYLTELASRGLDIPAAPFGVWCPQVWETGRFRADRQAGSL